MNGAGTELSPAWHVWGGQEPAYNRLKDELTDQLEQAFADFKKAKLEAIEGAHSPGARERYEVVTFMGSDEARRKVVEQ